MAGQGRPPEAHWQHPRAKIAPVLASLAALILLCIWTAPAIAEDLDLHLRASWGGGAAAVWSGSITLSSGQLDVENVLGLDADSPGVVTPTSATSLRITPRTPRAYDGVDLRVQAPRDAVLRIEFAGPNEKSPVKIEAPLAQLLAGRVTRELDATSNRFAIQRVAGDTLRFATERSHLVFSPREKWVATIQPQLIDGAANNATRCAFRLVSTQTKATVWQYEEDCALDESGSAKAVEFSVALPEEEGVYELVVELFSKRFGAPLVRTKPLAERQVQLVVVASDQATANGKEWTAVGEFDPAHPKLWDRMLRLPTVKLVPGFNKGPVGNEPSGTREHLGLTWSTLKAGGWQAYPLPVAEPGQPHFLEVDFPSDIAQSLAMSILEPNALGQVMPLGLDGGIDVVPVAARQSETQTHRIAFWPRTKSPLLLLTNRREDAPAIFGKVRVLAGPNQLSADHANDNQIATRERLVAAYFDRPLFPENFCVADPLDARSGRLIDDWSVFLQGGARLADYLHYSGQNGAVANVLCDGSGLYPSQFIRPNPKYDMGAFATLGSDPLRKDVVEMLLRIFDRERLQFIPAVQFTAPLPELEMQLAQGQPVEREGIELVGPDQERWIETNPPRRGAAPYYNLLDPRVQTAMRRVVLEIAERYADHASFTGVAVQISGDGYTQLPDEACALDEVTLQRFATEQQLTLPAFDPRRPSARWEWIQRQARPQWLQWRAEQVTAFYRAMREDLSGVQPGLKLLLCPIDPWQSRRLSQRLRPVLPAQDRVGEGMLQVGLDLESLSGIAGVSVSRPRFSQATPVAGADPLRAEYNAAPSLDRSTTLFPAPAALQWSDALPLRLEAFDKVSPFGAANTRLFMLSHLSPVGAEARRRFIGSLATADMHTLLDGGQLLTLGQEDNTRELLQTLQQIPAEPFETVLAAEDARTQPVVLRRWTNAQSTWFYAVNNCPWPVICDIDLSAPGALTMQRLDHDRQSQAIPSSNGEVHWKIRLDAYDMVAARCSRPAVPVKAWRTQVDRAVDAALREQIRDIRLRANSLRSPPPLTVLANESFENAAGAGQRVPNWIAAEGAGVTVELDRKVAKRGAAALHIASRAVAANEPAPVVWVRSEAIPTPATGRLAIWVWLRAADAKRQPKLRLAMEGKLDGQPYYRRANVGASEDGRETKPLLTEWSPFLFPVDDLPLQGLTDLQIGFDLMDEGEVWIDDVQVFDLWFQDIEQNSLLKNIALADFQVQQGKVGDSLQFLNSYWPQFLRRNVPLENTRVANLPERTAPPTSDSAPKPAPIPPPKTPGMFDGVRRWVPKNPFQK